MFTRTLTRDLKSIHLLGTESSGNLTIGFCDIPFRE